MNAEIQREINDLVKKVAGLSGVTKRERDKILATAAKPLQGAIAGAAPKSAKPHSRYDTPKISGKIKAPKGQGRIVATYQPGNLKKSISVLRFRHSLAVFIGPKVDKTGAGKMPDGYYAHMVNSGTKHSSPRRFVEAGVGIAGNTAKSIAIRLLKQKIEAYAAQNNLK